MARRAESLLAVGLVAGVALVWLAQYLGEVVGPLAWLGGGLLLLVSMPGLLLLGALTITGRTYRRRTWRPTQPLAAGQAEYERQVATSRTKRTLKTPGEPGTSWSPPMLVFKGRLVACSTLEVAVTVAADLDRTAQAVMSALVSPGWEAAATDTVVDSINEAVHVTRAPAGPADRDATYLGRETGDGLRASPLVIARWSLRRAGPADTTVTLSGACSATIWGEKRAATHLADAIQTLIDRTLSLVDAQADAGGTPAPQHARGAGPAPRTAVVTPSRRRLRLQPPGHGDDGGARRADPGERSDG